MNRQHKVKSNSPGMVKQGSPTGAWPRTWARWQVSDGLALASRVPMVKKWDRRLCSSYRGITLLSLSGKVYSRVFEMKLKSLPQNCISALCRLHRFCWLLQSVTSRGYWGSLQSSAEWLDWGSAPPSLRTLFSAGKISGWWAPAEVV